MTTETKQVDDLLNELLVLKRYMRDYYYKLPVVACLSRPTTEMIMDKTYYYTNRKLGHYTVFKNVLITRLVR